MPSLIQKTTQVTLGIALSTAVLGVATADAATLNISGTFGSTNNFGGISSTVASQFINGSFDGTFTGTLPTSANPASLLDSWHINLRNSVGQILTTLSNANNPGDPNNVPFAGAVTNGTDTELEFLKSSNPQSEGFFFVFTNSTGQFNPSYGGIYVDGNGNGIDVASGSVTAVPTPALLPGLIGLGAAALRRRKTTKVAA